MNRLAFCRDERHARFAARDQDRLAAERPVEFGRRRRDVGFAGEHTPRYVSQLLTIRSDQRRTGINRKVLTLGVDDHRFAKLVRSIDQIPQQAWGQQTLGIIGQHDAGRTRQGGE